MDLAKTLQWQVMKMMWTLISSRCLALSNVVTEIWAGLKSHWNPKSAELSFMTLQPDPALKSVWHHSPRRFHLKMRALFYLENVMVSHSILLAHTHCFIPWCAITQSQAQSRAHPHNSKCSQTGQVSDIPGVVAWRVEWETVDQI